MSKPVITFVFKVLRNFFVADLTHVQTCDNVRVQSATQLIFFVADLTHVQTGDNVRVQSAAQLIFLLQT